MKDIWRGIIIGFIISIFCVIFFILSSFAFACMADTPSAGIYCIIGVISMIPLLPLSPIIGLVNNFIIFFVIYELFYFTIGFMIGYNLNKMGFHNLNKNTNKKAKKFISKHKI